MHSNTSQFDRIVFGAIIANALVALWGFIDHAHELRVERVDTGFLIFFLIELLAKLRLGGWRWLRQPWNTVDAIIILLAICPVVGDSILILRIAKLARVLHLGRHVVHLRIAAWLGRWIQQRSERAGGRSRDRVWTTANLAAGGSR
jgi:hypothetical protein